MVQIPIKGLLANIASRPECRQEIEDFIKLRKLLISYKEHKSEYDLNFYIMASELQTGFLLNKHNCSVIPGHYYSASSYRLDLLSQVLSAMGKKRMPEDSTGKRDVER